MTANTEQREHWNSDEAAHWIRFESEHDKMLEPFGMALLDAASVRADDRVLDVGCGTGWTTLRAGSGLGATGQARGVDLSVPMVRRARERAKQAGLERSVTFAVRDAQTDDLGGPHDVIISRFGTMFFDDPRAAFANLRRALVPGGSLCFVCWQELLANDWLAVPGAAVATVLPLPEAGAAGSPGPFSLADPEDVHALLSGAGFREVAIEGCTTTVLLGGGLDIDGTLEYLRTSGIGRAVFDGATPTQTRAALDAARGALRPNESPEGIRLGAAAWLVTARG